MSDTPRTDAIAKPFIGLDNIPPEEASAYLDLARQLERELAEAKAEITRNSVENISFIGRTAEEVEKARIAALEEALELSVRGLPPVSCRAILNARIETAKRVMEGKE